MMFYANKNKEFCFLNRILQQKLKINYQLNKQTNIIRTYQKKIDCKVNVLDQKKSGQKKLKNHQNISLALNREIVLAKLYQKLKKEHGSTVLNQFEILNELRIFYDYLYQKRETLESENIYENLKLYDIPKLNKQMFDLLEGTLNKLEVYIFF